MHKNLLLKAYEKIRHDSVATTGIEPSLTACGEQLSIIVSEIFPYSEKSFRNLYKEASEGKEIFIKQPKVVHALAVFLGFEDYTEFIIKSRQDAVGCNKTFATTESVKGISAMENIHAVGTHRPKRENRFFSATIAIAVIMIIGLSVYTYVTKERWMEWDGNHYVEVPFDSEKVRNGNLKVFKEERIADFKKLIVSCETRFFNEDGTVRIWYGKNKDGVLQYFTSYGLHPETGKTLKPITQYMIEKYICIEP